MEDVDLEFFTGSRTDFVLPSPSNHIMDLDVNWHLARRCGIDESPFSAKKDPQSDARDHLDVVADVRRYR